MSPVAVGRGLAACLAAAATCREGAEVPEPTAYVEEIDLGPLPVRPAGPAGRDEPTRAVALDVPADALGLVALFESAEPGALSASATGPDDADGAPLLRWEAPHESPNPAEPTSRAMAVQIPITARPLVPGRYHFSLVGDRAFAAEAAARAFVKRPHPGAPAADVMTYEVTVFRVSREVSGGDLDQALERMEALLEGAGLLARARHLVTLADAEHLAEIELDAWGDGAALFELLARSAEAPADGVNVFVVEELVVPDLLGDLPLVGLAGGLPVPPVKGTPRSGVLVSAVWLRNDPSGVGLVLAHEVGHALGLFHTSEMTGMAHDPLADTPECGRARDRDGDGLLTPAECLTEGAKNLMFWTAYDHAGAGLISDEQGYVVRRNPLVR